MKDTSEEVRQTCAARLTSAASSAAVYFAVCCRIASAAVFASAAKTTGAAHETVMAIARQNSNVRAPTAMASLRLLTVNRPRDAKAIREHAKASGPKRFLKRHADGSSFGEISKQALGIAFTGVEHDAETPWRLVVARSRIGPLQFGIANNQRGVSYLAAPLRGHIPRHGRIAPGEHERDLAVQTAFVKLERGFALAVKAQIDARIQVHQIHYRGRRARSLVKMGARERSMLLVNIRRGRTIRASNALGHSSRRQSRPARAPAAGPR